MRLVLPSLLLSVLLLFSSCEVKMPEYVVSPNKMEAFLYDYHMVQSMSSEYTSGNYEEKLFFDYIFKKHGITKQRFDSSMVWYNRYPKHLKKVYENLEKRLEQEVAALGDAKGAVDDGVTLDMAYLAADTAELWTGADIKLLSSTPLNSRLSYAFEIPTDTTFLAGDSLSFSFEARFITGGVSGVKQSLYTALVVEYEDGTSFSVGKYKMTNGNCAISAPRNFASRPKYMSGFVYYSDDDSTAMARLLLNRISLKRMHAPKSVEAADKK